MKYSKTHLPWFPALNPYSWFHAKLVKGPAVDREYVPFPGFGSRDFSTSSRSAMVRDVKKVSEFDFDRIIPCHGVSLSPLLLHSSLIVAGRT
jgi:hypothetical protein